MANYKKRKTVKNSRAHCHRYGWTCQGRLRYERHFKEIERVEKKLMEVNRSFEALNMLSDSLLMTSNMDIRDVRVDELGCGCCSSLCFSLLIDGEWREFYINDDDVKVVKSNTNKEGGTVKVDLTSEFPVTAGIEILRAEYADVKYPFCALVRYKLDGIEPAFGIRMDLGKQVFLDHFDEGSPQEDFMLSICQRVWELIL